MTSLARKIGLAGKAEWTGDAVGCRGFARAAGLGLATLALLGLAACGGTVQDRLGMSRRAPDEMQVVRRQPLVVPPEYRLPPPGTSSPAQAGNVGSRDTQAALFGRTERALAVASPAERALLEAVPGAVEPNIRELILAENTELTQIDESRFLFILDWQRQRMQAGSGVRQPLDPQAEAARLEAEGASERVVTRRTGSSVVQ